jgi:hypothetical protein
MKLHHQTASFSTCGAPNTIARTKLNKGFSEEHFQKPAFQHLEVIDEVTGREDNKDLGLKKVREMHSKHYLSDALCEL